MTSVNDRGICGPMFLKKNKDSIKNEQQTVRKIVWIMIFSILFIVIVGSISGYLYIKSALEPVQKDSTETIAVSIPVGSSVGEIGHILENHNVIKDGRIFRFYTRFKKESGFQAGDYLFSPSMELAEIVASLQRGHTSYGAIYKITIPEGKTVAEIAEIYDDQMPFSKEEFLEKANDRDYVKELMDTYPDLLTKDILQKGIHTPLEGYLYAATYEFNEKNPSIETVIERMLDKSNEVIVPYKDRMKKMGFTIHEAVTFASIIEKETGTREQRKEIAGVFYNRLEKGIRLQTDPTVLYALGEHKEKVLFKDLEIDSPYNTYVIDALPIGPISNFGNHALEASLYPEQTNYLYFLHDEVGDIYFSETHDEHVAKKRKYIK